MLSVVFELEPDIEMVGEASNGLEAIELVRGGGVDVLLLDVAMPVMDGLEALPQIRRAAPLTKIIMLTGFGTASVRAEALAGGACHYLEKGLTPRELLDAVRSNCSQGGDCGHTG